MDEGTFSMNFPGLGDNSNPEDDDYMGEGVPLTPFTRAIVIVLHYTTFVFVSGLLYSYHERKEALGTRIGSTFLLLLAIGWLQVGPAFEIGNHFYINNWQLYNSEPDLVNASFSFFNFGSQNILALSFRKKGLPLLRPGENLLEWITIIGDIIFVVLTFAQPFVYAFLGRDVSVTFLSPFGALAGIFTMLRVWYNLGPNPYTKWGGIGFFALAIAGVVALSVYRATDAEWVHIFIGGSFVSSVIPLSIAIWNVESAGAEEGGDEETGGYGSTGESRPLVY